MAVRLSALRADRALLPRKIVKLLYTYLNIHTVYMLWHVDLLLGNYREISNYTRTTADAKE
jgi:hypothetical protein